MRNREIKYVEPFIYLDLLYVYISKKKLIFKYVRVLNERVVDEREEKFSWT